MMRVGRQIFVRTTALYASFLVAASVLARVGDAPLGAHQIAFELFIFLALLLDAVAIAGQVIVGRMLGAGDALGAHAAARRMIGWSVGLGAIFGVVLLALEPWLPRLFTSDPAVLHSADRIWVLFAVMQPLAGAVFALDGILIGAERHLVPDVVDARRVARRLRADRPRVARVRLGHRRCVGGPRRADRGPPRLPRDALRRATLGRRRLDLALNRAAARSGCTASATPSRPDTSPWPRRPTPSRR